jgi:hypothetical protein
MAATSGDTEFVVPSVGAQATADTQIDPGQQPVLLAHRLVGTDGDLTVAWRGHKGDDVAAIA